MFKEVKFKILEEEGLYYMRRDVRKPVFGVRKPVFGVFDQVWHKPGWAITEDG